MEWTTIGLDALIQVIAGVVSVIAAGISLSVAAYTRNKQKSEKVEEIKPKVNSVQVRVVYEDGEVRMFEIIDTRLKSVIANISSSPSSETESLLEEKPSSVGMSRDTLLLLGALMFLLLAIALTFLFTPSTVTP